MNSSTKYVSIVQGIGFDKALALSNSLTIAERLESPRHWGVFQNNSNLQTKTRLKAWEIVNRLREELEAIIETDLQTTLSQMKSEEVEIYQEDLLFKRKVFYALGKGNLSQEESLALLSAWVSTPFNIKT